MGKIKLTTKEQDLILGEIKQNDFLRSHFYFTGGTALSSVYLKHRYSDDLDFFSREQFENQTVFIIVEEWSRKHNFIFQSRFVDVVYIFNLIFKKQSTLKLDFAYYPAKQLEKYTVIDGINVDSLLDIAVNKLLTISQRNEVKDFVDLYFLLEKFSVWDLMEGMRVKFNVEIDPLLLATDFMKIEQFDFLPKMIKPLDLEGLKSFYKQKARDIGGKFTE